MQLNNVPRKRDILKLEKTKSLSIIVLIITICLSPMNNYLNDNIYFSFYFGVREVPCKMDSRDSLGWHLIEMAGTSYIPWRSTPMYIVLGIGQYMLKYTTLLNKVH